MAIDLFYGSFLGLLLSSISESDTKASVFLQKKKKHMHGHTDTHTLEIEAVAVFHKGAFVFFYPPPKKTNQKPRKKNKTQKPMNKQNPKQTLSEST